MAWRLAKMKLGETTLSVMTRGNELNAPIVDELASAGLDTAFKLDNKAMKITKIFNSRNEYMSVTFEEVKNDKSKTRRDDAEVGEETNPGEGDS
jgi:hypothetical protein